jgi:glycosyltransferase involved in cell wall biosynthesis
MKITQITYSGFGGLGSVVFSLIAANIEKDHQWSIVFIGDQALDASYLPLCNLYQLPYVAFQSTRGRPYRAWIGLARWLTKMRPDVVICHSINSILPCWWYTLRHGGKLIAVEHTSNQVKTKTERMASVLSILLADRVVVLTEEYREELKKAHGLLYRSPKVKVIPNGINSSIFKPTDISTLKNQGIVRLGMAGRFSINKRQDLLVDALLLLTELRPDLLFELRFAGNGDEFGRVQCIAKKTEASCSIHFDGFLTEAEMAEWLRNLDIYVHATDGETLSTALLQAMATGLPIVASDIPGVSNLVKSDGVYATCVPNTAEAFAKAVIAYVEDPDHAADVGRRARQLVNERYGYKTMLQKYLDTIDELTRST